MRRVAIAAATVAAAAVLSMAPAGAQTPDFSGTLVVAPTTTPPGSTATATATITPLQDTGPSTVQLTLTNTGGLGSFTIVSATPSLTGCALANANRAVVCSWDAQVADGVQTLVVDVNVDATTVVGSVWDLSLAAAQVQTPLEPALATATLTIEQQVTTTTTTAPTTTTEPPTTPTTTPTTRAQTPTTRENLPVTGSSGTPLLLGLGVLAGGAFLLFTARKFRGTDAS
jgi:mucin-6/19